MRLVGESLSVGQEAGVCVCEDRLWGEWGHHSHPDPSPACVEWVGHKKVKAQGELQKDI